MRFGSFQGLSLQNYGHDWSGDGATDLEVNFIFTGNLQDNKEVSNEQLTKLVHLVGTSTS